MAMYLLVLLAAMATFQAIALELAEEPYELVTVRESRGRHKRSLQAPLPDQLNVEFTLQHSTVKLRLRRNTRMQRQIPVIFEEEPEKIIYVSMEENVRAYQDADFGAAITITASGKDIGGLHGYSLDGSFHANGTHYKIHPNDSASSAASSRLHRVQKVTLIGYGDADTKDYIELPPEGNITYIGQDTQGQRRTKRAITAGTSFYDYHIETQFVMDYTIWSYYLTKANGSTVDALQMLNYYFIHIYNVLDLIYKRIDKKKWGYGISIYLLGYRIAATKTTSQWTEKAVISRQLSDDDTLVRATIALHEIGKWSQQDGRTWASPDHTMLFTRYDIYAGSKSSVGLAPVGGICRSGAGVSLIETRELYSVALVAAHELGHNLGSIHDGGSTGCSAADVYIMSPSIAGFTPTTIENTFRFSDCSLATMRDVLDGTNDGYPRVCAANRVCEHGMSMEGIDVLPGKKYSLDEQCARAFGEGHTFYENPRFIRSTICLVLECLVPNRNSYYTKLTGADDGTRCDENKCCQQGICSDNCAAPEPFVPDESCTPTTLSLPVPNGCADLDFNARYNGILITCAAIPIYFPELCFTQEYATTSCCRTCHNAGLAAQTQHEVSLVKVNGGWSSWSALGECSVTCGDGTRQRTRVCNNPLPSNGGVSCPETSTEISSCSKTCPVNGGWSSWSALGECSVTCGDGTRQRTRVCNNPLPSNSGVSCPGTSTETSSCKRICSVGEWTSWSVLGDCSVTCGSGLQQRTRICNNTSPTNDTAICTGVSLVTQSCTKTACPGSGTSTLATASLPTFVLTIVMIIAVALS